MGSRIVGAGLALAGLSACSVASEVDDTMSYAEMVAANADLAEAVAGLPNTTASEMPTRGTATFDGYAALALDTDRATDLVGTATLTADFGGDTIDGTLGDFAGRLDGGKVQRLDGELSVGDGDLRVLTASGFGANVDGVLTGRTRGVVGVDAPVFGNFRTEGGRGAAALTAASAGGTGFTVDGEHVGGLLTIVADR